MTDARATLERSKSILMVACNMLLLSKKQAPVFSRVLLQTSADYFVLLTDATKLFCQSAAEIYHETENRRWSPLLPEFLFSHPERCAEILALLEREDFHEPPYLQFAAA